MNFQQLHIIRETVRRNFNLTEAANALYTSPSGVSKHIKDFEDELGIQIFLRKGKRLLGLTEPGKELAQIVERILLDTKNIKSLAVQYSNLDCGQLTVATTHTQARYALPSVITRFKQLYPKVHLVLHQASPTEIASMLVKGEADIGIATETLAETPELVSFPYYDWHHSIVVPVGHPLIDVQPLSLAAVAAYPILTYHEGFTGRNLIDRAFAQAQINADIVMSALDADVIKSYVELGLGVGIVASVAYHATRDSGLQLLASDHLFGSNTTLLALRRGNYLRGYACRFVELCSPSLTDALVREAISSFGGVVSAV